MAPAAEVRVPPLVTGDKLTRDEFLRRWEAHPEIKGRQTPTRCVGAEVGFSSLRSPANSRGDARRTTAKPSDGSAHGVRAARSTRTSTNWHVPSALPRKASGQKIGRAS